MNIATFLSEKQIVLQLKSQTKEEAVAELASKLAEVEKIRSVEEFVRDVWGREGMGDTAVGFGIAIPHARSAAAVSPGIAIGRTEGLRWNGENDGLVRLVVLLAVPEEKADRNHMAILSNVARMLVDEESRNSIMHAETEREVLNVIERYQRSKGGGME